MKKIMKFLAAAIVFIISFSQAAFAGSDTSITDDGFIPATVEQFVYLFNMEFGSKPELLISNLSKYDGNASNDEEHDIYVGTLGKSTSILIWADKNTDRVYGVGLFQNTAKAAADVYIQREIYSGAVTLSGLFCGIDKNNVKDLEVIFPGLDLNARIKPYSTWNKFGNIVIGLDINESEMSFITFVDLDNKKIKIAVNDEFIDLTTAPEIIDNRVFVPVRGLFENLNAEVLWNGNNNSVTIKNNEKEIVVTLNSAEAFINGRKVSLDTPPQNVNGSIFVPVRFISEALDAEVQWDAENMVVDISISN